MAQRDEENRQREREGERAEDIWVKGGDGEYNKFDIQAIKIHFERVMVVGGGVSFAPDNVTDINHNNGMRCLFLYILAIFRRGTSIFSYLPFGCRCGFVELIKIRVTFCILLGAPSPVSPSKSFECIT